MECGTRFGTSCAMIFDFRTFLGQSFDGARQSPTDLLRSMDALRIDMALACPFKPVSYDLERANQELAESIRRHADRLVGAARIDPWKPDAAESLERAFSSYG